MIPLVLSILVGIGSNFDNFTFQSTREHDGHVPWLFCCMVAVISALSVVGGGMTAQRLASRLPTPAGYVVGAVILVCVGSWSLVQTWLPSVFTGKSGTQLGQVRLTRKVSFGLNEMMFIGLSNCLTALTAGFGVGFANLSLVMSAVSVGVFNFLFLIIPAWSGLGHKPRQWGEQVILVCSMLLIVTALQL